MEPNRFPHIVSNPLILGGKPCINGTRISVDLLLEWLASGATIPEILTAYPQLSQEAVNEALLYAAAHLKNEICLEIPTIV